MALGMEEGLFRGPQSPSMACRPGPVMSNGLLTHMSYPGDSLGRQKSGILWMGATRQKQWGAQVNVISFAVTG